MENNKKHLFDNPQNVKRILHVLYFICAMLLGLEFVIHRHTMHNWENLWGFYSLFGFVACVTLVLIAKWMRTFLMRSENYYDREELKDINGDSNVDD